MLRLKLCVERLKSVTRVICENHTEQQLFLFVLHNYDFMNHNRIFAAGF